MTDHTAICAAGEALVNLFREKMTPETVPKAEQIGLCAPQQPENFQLTVWIYSIEFRKGNGEYPSFQTMPENPGEERFAPLELELYAMISAHSKTVSAQKLTNEYRILGRAIQTVYDHPTVPQKYFKNSFGDRPVLLELSELSADDLIKIWNNASRSVPPSFAVRLSPILIRSERTRKALPKVRSARFDTELKDEQKGGGGA